jgi:predicted metal-dependent enzyme (double-stranded beta helix superfamily)
VNPILGTFRDSCTNVISETLAPADIVRRLAPVMGQLAKVADDFLEPAHRRSDPNGYARNLIFAAEDDTLSLFSLVWTPGQWTPIHDHGTWGVVGIAEGLLEEQAFVRIDDSAAKPRNTGIELAPGGLVLLPPGAVSTFVPNPDHIHETGVASDRPATLSLHLYGRMLNNFHIYDRQAGTRRLIEAHHKET